MSIAILTTIDTMKLVDAPLGWPTLDLSDQLQAAASVGRELFLFEAGMCFFAIVTKYYEPLAGVNRDSDDDRYDEV